MTINYNYSFISGNDGNLFFSLMDFRNNYFISDNPNKIIEFYNGFKNRNQLVEWMKERPKGNYLIKEIEGNKNIIVVIPTIDVENEFSRNCRENIFKGLHIIFVESGYNNFYFNYAHNCNAGIQRAMSFNPKWIVVCNDDMYKIDDINILIKELNKLDQNKFNAVFTQPSLYHSSPERISKRNILYFLFYYFANKDNGRIQLKLYKKFGVNFSMSPLSGLFSKLFKKGYTYLETQSFAIFSSKWVELFKYKIYDDIFINACEDTDLSLKLSLEPERISKIDFKIGDIIGSSLGKGISRSLRDITGLSYLNFKWSEKIYSLILGVGMKR